MNLMYKLVNVCVYHDIIVELLSVNSLDAKLSLDKCVYAQEAHERRCLQDNT